MKADPPVRKDGRCALKTCRKKRKITKQAMKYCGDELIRDPFCSTTCCREWHGCPLPGIQTGKKRK